jgi:hypothetical protein
VLEWSTKEKAEWGMLDNMSMEHERDVADLHG